MAGTRGMNTMVEGLQKMSADLAFMKSLPDADLEWIIDIETQVVQKLREPITALQESGAGNMGPGSGAGADVSMLPGGSAIGGGGPTLMGPPPGGPGPGGPPGPMPGPIPGGMMPTPPPNPGSPGVSPGTNIPGDELRRMLNQ